MTKRGDIDMDTRRNLLKKKQRVVIKIGSSSLQHTETGDMDYIRLEVLVRELCNLKNQGKDVVLVSSGAIAQGKKAVHLTPEQLQEHPIAVKQACAAVGQARLMMTYQKIFAEYNQVTAQILMTRQTISNDINRINAQNTFEELFRMGVIPIVNENDTISVSELMFTDNDELSGLIATMMGMDALIILSNIDGIYNGNPSDPSSTVIREIDGSKEDLSEYVQTSKSSFGRGGMLTKCSIAQKVADEGITVIIANGKKDNILVDLLAKDSRTVCTRFIPSNKPVSSVKKWIAHSEGFAKGEIHINRGAEEALLGPKATSILLVGVTRIIGDFEKDDIVKVINEEGVQLGVGCAGYDSTEARELIGSRDKKPLVHYDYLYLD